MSDFGNQYASGGPESSSFFPSLDEYAPCSDTCPPAPDDVPLYGGPERWYGHDPERMSDPLYGATMPQALMRFLRRGTQFDGRSSRSEFWWVALAMTALQAVLVLVLLVSMGLLSDPGSGASPVWFIFVCALVVLAPLVLLVPSLSLTVRRLHDAGFSGWFVLLGLAPYGCLAVAVLAAMRTETPFGSSGT